MKSISSAERRHAGKALREVVPRAAHGCWAPSAHPRDPVEIIERCNRGRLTELVPIRYARMLRSPFAFLRGSPALDAARATLDSYAAQARAMLAELPDGPARAAFEALTYAVLDRTG